VTSPAGGAYDIVEYPGLAFRQTRPDRLAAIGRLHGMRPAAVGACRVLELGCGDGVNLLTMAAARPGSEFVGVDAAARAIGSGRALVEAAGLANVRLLELDLERLPDDLGRFDYVVAHGVYSWVPPSTRSALLRACRELLAPDGIAFVSYNAYPGSYLRDMANEAFEWHLRGVTDPAERVRGARELMELTLRAGGSTRAAHVLQGQMQELLEKRPELLFHDDLAAVNTPVWFHEFASHARAHGLQFLSEATVGESRALELTPGLAPAVDALARDRLEREQYTDILKNRQFRETLLCHAEVELRDGLDAEAVGSMWVSAEEPGEVRVDTSNPLVQQALASLRERRPEAVPVASLEGGPALLEMLTQAYVAGLVELWDEPPPVASGPGERPAAAPLARAQATAGSDHASSLLHGSVELSDELGRRLITLLDGSRDRAALARELDSGGGTEELLDSALDRLASVGLLVG
jgi:SAM-dependent methyltransferase